MGYIVTEKALASVESALTTEWMPTSAVMFECKYGRDYTVKALRRLHKRGVARRRNQGHKHGTCNKMEALWRLK